METNTLPQEAVRKFTDFAIRMRDKVSTSPALGARGRHVTGRGKYDLTVEELREMIAKGVPDELEQISSQFYRSNGIYFHMIKYLSTLLLYDTVVIPKVKPGATVTNKAILTRFDRAVEFIDNLNIAPTFTRVMQTLLVHGAYYGLMRDYGGASVVFQDLPYSYCRSRYKSKNDLDLLEFDLSYFDRIWNVDDRTDVLKSFPIEFHNAYRVYVKNRSDTRLRWYEVPESMGIVFSDTTGLPYLIASLPSCLIYDEAQDDERQRDQQELEKLLILEMPIGENDEPVFDLDETAAIHEGVASMLAGAKYVNVLTTFGTAKLESAQDNTQASRDKLSQYKRATYDSVGSSAILFNADGSASLEYSIDRDTACMLQFAKKFALWLTYQLNRRVSSSNIFFDIEILPTTIYNRKQLADLFLGGAQFGYSKMYAAAALGIKQSNLMGLVRFENDVLKLSERLTPLQSSHTQSLKKGEGKNEEAAASRDSSKEGTGGRPALDQTEKKESTVAKEDSR